MIKTSEIFNGMTSNLKKGYKDMLRVDQSLFKVWLTASWEIETVPPPFIFAFQPLWVEWLMRLPGKSWIANQHSLHHSIGPLKL